MYELTRKFYQLWLFSGAHFHWKLSCTSQTCTANSRVCRWQASASGKLKNAARLVVMKWRNHPVEYLSSQYFRSTTTELVKYFRDGLLENLCISFLMVCPLIKIVFKPLWRKSVYNCVDKCTSDFHEVQFWMNYQNFCQARSLPTVPGKRNFCSGATQIFRDSRMCLQTIHYIYATKGGYRVYNRFSISTRSRKKKIR